MYSFWSIGRCCEATGGKTHGDVGMAVLERGGRCFGGTMEAHVRCFGGTTLVSPRRRVWSLTRPRPKAMGIRHRA